MGSNVLTKFQEGSLDVQQKRACSLYAVSAYDTYLIVIHKTNYHMAVKACKRRIKNEKKDFFSSVELIKILGPLK